MIEDDVLRALSGLCCHVCSLRFANSPKLSSLKHADLSENSPSAKRQKKNECVTCFDLLLPENVQMVIDKSSSCLEDGDYDDHVFTITLSMPVSTGIREYGVYLHLSEVIADYQAQFPWQQLPTVKDVLKQLTAVAVGRRLNKRADNGYFADLQVNVLVHYRGDRRETQVIEKLRDSMASVEASTGPVTRMMVDSVISYHQQQQQQARHRQLEHGIPVPPSQPVHPVSYSFTCSRASIFLAGRYNKYSRCLSQTPWLVAGERRTELSVLEMLSQHIISVARAADVKFSSSGREDVDVRTLGAGRPFVLELIEPHVTRFSSADLRAFERCINKEHGRVFVRDLQIVSRESTLMLKQGEQERSKTYTALVRSCTGDGTACVCTDDDDDDGAGKSVPCASDVCRVRLRRLSSIKELELSQQTPVRVLHRRPIATRTRIIHWMSAEPLSNSLFKLRLCTQAGTYIKEFVHGDLGRTDPSVTSLLLGSGNADPCPPSAKYDIVALDVDSVQLDWPPAVKYGDSCVSSEQIQ